MPMSGFSPPMLLSLSSREGLGFCPLAGGTICSISSIRPRPNEKLLSPNTTASKVFKKFWAQKGEKRSWVRIRVENKIHKMIKN